MPYSSNSELPKAVKDALPDKAQSIFRHVVNSELARGLSDSRAFAAAWSTLSRQGWEKGEDGKWMKKMDEARVVKVSEELGLVFGWAVVCKVNGEDYYDRNIDHSSDGYGEIVPEHIPEDAMLKAATDFMANTERSGNEMHAGPDSGQYVFAWPMTTDIAKALGIDTPQTGLLVAYKPTPEVLEKYKDGTYRGFSIEGARVRSEELTDG